MYELAEAADQELKVRRESQQIFIRRSPRSKFIAPPARPQKVEWKDQRNDYRRSDSYEQYNNVSRESSSRSSESARIGKEWNPKQCRYCKNIGHEIEECCKRQCNNSQNNFSGNLRNPSRPTDGSRAGPNRIRPVNVIEIQETEEEENAESQ